MLLQLPVHHHNCISFNTDYDNNGNDDDGGCGENNGSHGDDGLKVVVQMTTMMMAVMIMVVQWQCVDGHGSVMVMVDLMMTQGLTLASDIGHLTNKICKCPIDVSYKRTNVLLICYKGGHCPIISSFTRTS